MAYCWIDGERPAHPRARPAATRQSFLLCQAVDCHCVVALSPAPTATPGLASQCVCERQRERREQVAYLVPESVDSCCCRRAWPFGGRTPQYTGWIGNAGALRCVVPCTMGRTIRPKRHEILGTTIARCPLPHSLGKHHITTPPHPSSITATVDFWASRFTVTSPLESTARYTFWPLSSLSLHLDFVSSQTSVFSANRSRHPARGGISR